MQGTEIPTIFLETDLDAQTAAMHLLDDEDQLEASWALDAPPLRYDVASLQHWLDLNA